jgi:hypothetical protein
MQNPMFQARKVKHLKLQYTVVWINWLWINVYCIINHTDPKTMQNKIE